MTYYTLIARDGDDWYPQFGDTSRKTVKYELDDYVRGGNYQRNNLAIVTSEDDQSSVDTAIRLFAKWYRRTGRV
jgi:hypothetical protein